MARNKTKEPANSESESEGSEPEFVVEKILNKRNKNGKVCILFFYFLFIQLS